MHVNFVRNLTFMRWEEKITLLQCNVNFKPNYVRQNLL